MSVDKIHELRKKSDAFARDLDRTIENIVTNNIDLLELNKQQLKKSTLADGSPMKKPLSPSYAEWKSINYPDSFGDGKPNWLLTGVLFNKMTIKSKGQQYFINSTVPYAPKLKNRFGNGFGIAPVNHPKAQKITTDLLREEYERKVL